MAFRRQRQWCIRDSTVAVPSGAKVDGSINTAANRVSWLILTYSSRGSRWEGNWFQIPN